MLMLVVYMKFILQLHCLTCIWIMIGKVEQESYFSSFFNRDEKGWVERNIEKYGDTGDAELYVYALSLITETISKVGYGMEHAPMTSVEMIFLIIVIM